MALAARGDGPFSIQVKSIDAVYKWNAADYPQLPTSATQAYIAEGGSTAFAQQSSGDQHPVEANKRIRNALADLVEPADLREHRMHDTSYFRGE